MILFVLSCFVVISACSTFKGLRGPKQSTAPFDSGLVSNGQDEVTKKLGEPTVISRTPEGQILWIYRPSLKLLPNDKGTLYVEFEDGKVAKTFRKK